MSPMREALYLPSDSCGTGMPKPTARGVRRECLVRERFESILAAAAGDFMAFEQQLINPADQPS